jgi:hypothetical protein
MIEGKHTHLLFIAHLSFYVIFDSVRRSATPSVSQRACQLLEEKTRHYISRTATPSSTPTLSSLLSAPPVSSIPLQFRFRDSDPLACVCHNDTTNDNTNTNTTSDVLTSLAIATLGLPPNERDPKYFQVWC